MTFQNHLFVHAATLKAVYDWWLLNTQRPLLQNVPAQVLLEAAGRTGYVIQMRPNKGENWALCVDAPSPLPCPLHQGGSQHHEPMRQELPLSYTFPLCKGKTNTYCVLSSMYLDECVACACNPRLWEAGRSRVWSQPWLHSGLLSQKENKTQSIYF